MTWDQFLLWKSDLVGLLMFMLQRCIQGWYNAESHISGAPISLLLGPSCWNLRLANANGTFAKFCWAKFQQSCCNKVAFAKVPPPQPTDLPVKEVEICGLDSSDSLGLFILTSQGLCAFWVMIVGKVNGRRCHEKTFVRTLCARNMCFVQKAKLLYYNLFIVFTYQYVCRIYLHEGKGCVSMGKNE